MLVWMDLEMTGLDHTRDRIVEIATIVTDDELRIIAEGPDLVVHADDEDAGGDGADRRRDAHEVRVARRDPRLDRDDRGGGCGDARLHPRARHRPAHRPVVRQLDRHRPALPRQATCRRSRTTSTTDPSTCPASRSSSSAGIPTSPRACRARPGCTVPSTTFAARSRSCATTAAWCSCHRSPSSPIPPPSADRRGH